MSILCNRSRAKFRASNLTYRVTRLLWLTMKLLSGMPLILMALNHARCDSSNSNQAIAGYSHNWGNDCYDGSFVLVPMLHIYSIWAVSFSSNYESVDSCNQEEGFRRNEMAKLPLDYHLIFLEYYRKGGKPTIQKDVVIICYKLKNLPLLDDEELPSYPLDFTIMISIVTSALLEDGTEVPYKDRVIRVRP